MMKNHITLKKPKKEQPLEEYIRKRQRDEFETYFDIDIDDELMDPTNHEICNEWKQFFDQKRSAPSYDDYKIPLRDKNKNIVGYSFVSKEDYDDIAKYSWSRSRFGYIQNMTLGKMHRYIILKRMKLVVEKGYVVDHINSKKHDNRRSNLRIVTIAQNTQNNASRKNVNSSTQYRNVYKTKSKTNPWCAAVRLNGKRIYLGNYDSDIHAAEAFDCWLYHQTKIEPLLFKFNFPNNNYETMVPFVKKEQTSKYRGVFKAKNNRFIATVFINGKSVKLGDFLDEIDAANAVDNAILKHNLRGTVNFPANFPDCVPLQNIHILKRDIDNVVDCVQLITRNNDIEKANVTIDRDDYDSVKNYPLSFGSSRQYVKLSINGKYVLLHRFIMGVTDPAVFVDHIDGNGLNCTRKNLRLSNALQNAQNRTTKHTGVVNENGKYRAKIFSGNKNVFRKTYTLEDDARRARDIFLIDNPQYRHKKFYNDWTPELVEKWKKRLEALKK